VLWWQLMVVEVVHAIEDDAYRLMNECIWLA